MHLLIILSYKTLKLKSISNELWKGWKLTWYHHFTHIECANKLRGLRQNMDALRVQNEQSLSKYQAFIRKLVCYKGSQFFELYDTENEKHYKWTLKRLKVGMVSSLDPHSMCKNVERVTSKTGCTSCTKRTISFEVSGFHTETRLLQRDFSFLNLFELHSFSMRKMHHSKPHH